MMLAYHIFVLNIFLLALAVFFIVGLLPTLLVLLYPFKFCQVLFVIFPPTWKVCIHTFTDTIQGFYKDGTEPKTCDYRWLAGLILGARFIFIIIYGYTLTESFFIAVSVILVLFVVAFVIADPYNARYNHLSSNFVIFILFIASVCTGSQVYSYVKNAILRTIVYVLAFFLSVIPILYLSTIIFLWFLHHRRSGWELLMNLNAKLKGHTGVHM